MKDSFRLGSPIVSYLLAALLILLILLDLFTSIPDLTATWAIGLMVIIPVILLMLQSVVLNQKLKSLQRFTDSQSAQLAELAERDPETSLYAESALRTRLTLEVARSRRYRRALSLMMLEISDLSGFIRNHGRVRAKQVINEFANLLNSTLRTTDIIGHNGEARFTIALPDTERLQAFSAAKRIQDALAHFNVDQGIDLMASIGISEYHGEVIESFVLVTEARLDQAKRQGFSQIVVD